MPDELSYREVGATRDGPLPSGYRHIDRRVKVGDGERVFATVATGMRGWEIHRLAGIRLRMSGAPRPGAEFVAGLPAGPLSLWVPCMIVWVRDEPSYYGYGFGTLPGHPERGEEAFAVTREASGEVWFSVRAFSQHDSWYARLGGPVTALVQDRVVSRYLQSARTLAARSRRA